MINRLWVLMLMVGGLIGCKSLPHGSHPVHEEPSSRDRAFINWAASANAYEVAAAELAQQNATSDRIKTLAAEMLKDHHDTEEHLTEVAKELHLSIASDHDASHRSMLAELRSRAGADFDQAYLQQQVTAHEQSIAAFEKQIIEGEHSAARAFAQSHLPSLRAHLRKLKELYAATTQPSAK